MLGETRIMHALSTVTPTNWLGRGGGPADWLSADNGDAAISSNVTTLSAGGIQVAASVPNGMLYATFLINARRRQAGREAIRILGICLTPYCGPLIREDNGDAKSSGLNGTRETFLRGRGRRLEYLTERLLFQARRDKTC